MVRTLGTVAAVAGVPLPQLADHRARGSRRARTAPRPPPRRAGHEYDPGRGAAAGAEAIRVEMAEQGPPAGGGHAPGGIPDAGQADHQVPPRPAREELARAVLGAEPHAHPEGEVQPRPGARPRAHADGARRRRIPSPAPCRAFAPWRHRRRRARTDQHAGAPRWTTGSRAGGCVNWRARRRQLTQSASDREGASPQGVEPPRAPAGGRTGPQRSSRSSASSSMQALGAGVEQVEVLREDGRWPLRKASSIRAWRRRLDPLRRPRRPGCRAGRRRGSAAVVARSHPHLAHHPPGEGRRADQVVRRAARELPEDQFLGRAAGHDHRHPLDALLPRRQELVLGRAGRSSRRGPGPAG